MIIRFFELIFSKREIRLAMNVLYPLLSLGYTLSSLPLKGTNPPPFPKFHG